MAVTTSATFLLNCRILIEAGYFHFDHIFTELNELASKRKSSEKGKAIKKCLVEAIELHIEIMR